MSDKKYREKLKEVEARHFDGDQQELADVVAWIQEQGYVWFDMFTPASACGVSIDPSSGSLILVNKKGELSRVQRGYWVVKQPNGNLEPLADEEFHATFEEIDDSTVIVAPIDPTPVDPTPVEPPVDPTPVDPPADPGVESV